jgi:hypothetical protein
MGWNSKFLELKFKINDLEVEIWKLKNPPKFKVFDKVKLKLLYISECIDAIITADKIVIQKEWYYDIHTENGTFLGRYKQSDLEKRNESNKNKQASK